MVIFLSPKSMINDMILQTTSLKEHHVSSHFREKNSNAVRTKKLSDFMESLFLLIFIDSARV